MKYIKFKPETKERCLEALDSLNRNELFEYIVENMLEPTAADAARCCVDMNADDIQVPPLQGVARVINELVTLSRDAHKKRGHQNKK